MDVNPQAIIQRVLAAATSGHVVGATTALASNLLGLVNGVAGNVGLIVQGASAQSADLQQWQNSAATVLANVNSAGMINDSCGIGSITRIVAYNSFT